MLPAAVELVDVRVGVHHEVVHPVSGTILEPRGHLLVGSDKPARRGVAKGVETGPLGRVGVRVGGGRGRVRVDLMQQSIDPGPGLTLGLAGDYRQLEAQTDCPPAVGGAERSSVAIAGSSASVIR